MNGGWSLRRNRGRHDLEDDAGWLRPCRRMLTFPSVGTVGGNCAHENRAFHVVAVKI